MLQLFMVMKGLLHWRHSRFVSTALAWLTLSTGMKTACEDSIRVLSAQMLVLVFPPS